MRYVFLFLILLCGCSSETESQRMERQQKELDQHLKQTKDYANRIQGCNGKKLTAIVRDRTSVTLYFEEGHVLTIRSIAHHSAGAHLDMNAWEVEK